MHVKTTATPLIYNVRKRHGLTRISEFQGRDLVLLFFMIIYFGLKCVSNRHNLKKLRNCRIAVIFYVWSGFLKPDTEAAIGVAITVNDVLRAVSQGLTKVSVLGS